MIEFPEDCDEFIQNIEVTPGCLTIRSDSFPVTSVPPDKENRYNVPGQPTYYVASGLATAKIEKCLASDAPIPAGETAWQIPIGTHRLLNLVEYLQLHPEDIPLYCGSKEDGSYEFCQKLRTLLEPIGCSGVLYPSHADPGGICIAVWPLTGDRLPDPYFGKTDVR